MKPYKSLLPTVLFAALALGAAPVEAQSGHGGGGGFHGGGGGFHSGGGFHGGGGFRMAAAASMVPAEADSMAAAKSTIAASRSATVASMAIAEVVIIANSTTTISATTSGTGSGSVRGSALASGSCLDIPSISRSTIRGTTGTIRSDRWPSLPDQGYGGVSFSISPSDASVTVDGTVAGTVDQFNDPQSPLNLPPGQHHIQVQAPGYSTLDFDVNVEAGRVVPYAGDLQRQ